MTWHLHRVAGCRPTPLAHYLKALGILRLVARQADPGARACWQKDELLLISQLDSAALERFFLEDYAPTPILTPWNGGSGFYPKDNKAGIDALTRSEVPRFAAYREAIEVARALVGERDKSPKQLEKAKLLKACKAGWQGAALEWVDAATVVVAVSDSGVGDIAYPALLGSGGNDGRLDFANNFMQRLSELLPLGLEGNVTPHSEELLRQALWAKTGRGLSNDSIGQFFPGAAGGANSTSGYSGDSLVNPWDYVLMLEGAVALQVAAVRRLDERLAKVSAPFAVRAQTEGYASAAPSDASARGEQWMPIWERPATYDEVRALFAEGRLQAGQRRAGEALEAAQAVARLGVARGVTRFERYAYIERNGQANLAVPLGSWRVQNNPRLHLLDEIEHWVSRLGRQGDNQPAFARHARRLESLMLEACRQRPENMGPVLCRLLEALGAAEAEIVHRPKVAAKAALRPISSLSSEWLDEADDHSPEFALASAIASQYRLDENVSIRHHLMPIEHGRFRTTNDSLAADRDVVWTDRDLVRDLAAVALRCATNAEPFSVPGETEHKVRRFPLAAERGANPADVAAFLRGELNDERISRLARALMAVRKVRPGERQISEDRPGVLQRAEVPVVYALFRVLYSPWSLENPPHWAKDEMALPPLRIRLDSAPLRLLLGGRIDAAGNLAMARLRAAGGRPKVTRFWGSESYAHRLAAAMAIPVAWSDLWHLVALVFKPDLQLETESEVSA